MTNAAAPALADNAIPAAEAVKVPTPGLDALAKSFEPAAIESRWGPEWEQSGQYEPTLDAGKPSFSIQLPPPNVTGTLHMGHAFNQTIMDSLTRYHRMRGHNTLWVPGTDHAGIATQIVVERKLQGEGKNRHDLGRKNFVAKVWEWKEESGSTITRQMRRMGDSVAWKHEYFTMDPKMSTVVTSTFVDLYKQGLIYRGKRLVNWDPILKSAVSDLEVENEERDSFMWHIEYPFSDGPQKAADGSPLRGMHIATTRPETMLADGALAVHPGDERYKHLVGKMVDLPLCDRQIPVIADDYVDPEFGSGVVKITGAHDFNDYQVAQRHNLPLITIFTLDAKINENGPKQYQGLDRYDCRKAVLKDLEEQGFLEKAVPHKNMVPVCARTGAVVEPMLTDQWFVALSKVSEQDPTGKSIAQKAREAVSSGEVRFVPEQWVNTYNQWMNNIQDWCISRQLWWGHRIPVWTREYSDIQDFQEMESDLGNAFVKTLVGSSAETYVFEGNVEIVVGCRSTEVEPGRYKIEAATLSPEGATKLERNGFVQNPDVLDTWFSSWLWPFATMGWPEDTETLKTFYPTTDLVTGPDIIFFWVARMIMAGYEYMGELPFQNVYFTGIIRDKQGRKMSKSLGNSPDPLDLIAKFGADALRFGVMRSAPLGADVTYDEKNVELGRNFCTKLWNAARFRQMQSGDLEAEIHPRLLTSDDKWILLQLDQAVREVSAALDEYRFSDATSSLYRFFWSEFCDWYLEASKASLNGEDPARKQNTLAVIDFVLSHTLRLFHPFLPFITEELWHGLGYSEDMPADQGGRTIMNAPWPSSLNNEERHYFDLDPSHHDAAQEKYDAVNASRGLRRDFNIASNKRVKFVLRNEFVQPHDHAVLTLLMGAEPLELVGADWAAPKGTPVALTPLGELFLPLEGLVDPAAERDRLAKEIAKVEQELTKVRAKLADENFAAKVPAAVLTEHRQREETWALKLTQLQKMLEALS